MDIDPIVSSGFIHDRYDLLIRGRTVSALPVDEIAVTLDGYIIGRVQYGEIDQPSAPHERDAGQYVFHINVPLRRGDAHRACDCRISVRTTDGNTRDDVFSLAVDPSKATPVSVVSGSTYPAAAYSHILPPIVLYVERATLDDRGHFTAIGWAISRSPMVAVQAFVGEHRLDPAQLGGRRDDVASAFPAYANARLSGFTLSSAIGVPTESLATVRIQAISRNGFLHEAILPVERVRAPAGEASLPPVPFISASAATQGTFQIPTGYQIESEISSLLATPILVSPTRQPLERPRQPSHDTRREIRYFCDELDLNNKGRLSAIGWAVCPIGISTVDVYLDGKSMGTAELGLPRNDVGDEYRHIPLARYSGFRFVRTIDDVPAGEHELRVAFRNGLDDEQDEVRLVLIERPEEAPPPPPQSDPQRFRLEIDTPAVVAGTATDPITGRLTIEGWALARSGITGIEVMLDDQRLGDAHYGLARQDVGTAFPDWTDSLRSGYAFHCPPRSLRNGEHVVQLNVRARSGEVLEHRFNIVVRKTEEFEEDLTIRRRMKQVEVDVAEDVLDSLAHRPGFRIVLRRASVAEPEHLLATLNSLRSQLYREWRLEIPADEAGAASDIVSFIAAAAEDLRERIDVSDLSDETTLDEPMGSRGLSTAQRFVGILNAGDELGCDALLRIALASGLHRDADMLYGDEVRKSPASGEKEPFFKPDFSPDLLLATNYIGRPWFASTTLFGRCGVTARDLQRNGEYDAVLRCSERAEYIHHVPALLCSRGPQQIDDAGLESAALARAANRRGIAVEILPAATSGTWRFRRTHEVSGKVSIIIPTCAARGYIETCIRSLRERTAYRNFEIVCIDNIPGNQVAWKIWLQQNADKVVPMPDDFNWSRFNNIGANEASGEYLLFLNDDIEIIQPDWLDAMLEHIDRPEVAVVGAQLLYPDNKVQHAGMFLAAPGIARHAFRFAPSDDPGYFGLALTQRNVVAVTGACMLMRRGIHNALGGFEEAHQIINNDLDFCLRAHQAGKLVVFTPYASLMHYEAASRDRLKDVFDLGHFETRWKTLFAKGDPYFSPRLTRHSDDYRPDNEAVEAIFAGHPLFRHRDIKRILVVKADHIGDFVTALPAIRRLKQIFPAASIHVMAGRAARAFAELEDCIDEFIEFQFFHPVSGQGQVEITREEYEALREKLTPYRFDIAVDLRKHLDTRDVLRYTGARFLVGYDYMGQFPFLDISLEWEGDKNLQRKRSHVTDDLINLVEATGTACALERTRLPAISKAAKLPDFLSNEARALFIKPVVAVHPGVGNVMRQWPGEYFAALIDLMVERNGVNVILIGGPEETELAENVHTQLLHREAVVSLAGKTSLRQLTDLLSACALYIGNNSGPKHIAAALDVPTIGIHSGVVDAIEWGPIGKRSVAVRRNMACSPCYLARLEDCPRNFACMRGLEPIAVQEIAEFFLARPVERRKIAPIAEPLRNVVVPETGVVAASGNQPRARQAEAPAAEAEGTERRPRRRRGRAGQASSVTAE